MNTGGSLGRVAALALAALLATGCAGVGPVSGPSADVAAAGAPAEQNFERGKLYFAQGKTGLAVAAFRLALDDDPQSVRVLNGLAASYDRLRRFDLADRYYRRALAIDPGSAQTLNNLGYSHLLRGSGAGDLALARQYLEQARALDAGNMVVAANLARLNDLAAPPAAAEATLAGLGVGVSIVKPGAAWIERTSLAEQHLVTAPDPNIAALARRFGLAPQVAAVSPAFGCAEARDCGTRWRSGAVADRLPRLDPATRSTAESSAAGCADARHCPMSDGSVSVSVATPAGSIDYEPQLATVRPAAGCADALDCMVPLRSDPVAVEPPPLDPTAQGTDEPAVSGCADTAACVVSNGVDSVIGPSRHLEHGVQLAAVRPAAGCADVVGCLTQLRSGVVAALAEPPIGPGALAPT